MAYLAIRLRNGPSALTPANPAPLAHATMGASAANKLCNPSSAAIIGAFSLVASRSYAASAVADPTSPPSSAARPSASTRSLASRRPRFTPCPPSGCT